MFAEFVKNHFFLPRLLWAPWTYMCILKALYCAWWFLKVTLQLKFCCCCSNLLSEAFLLGSCHKSVTQTNHPCRLNVWSLLQYILILVIYCFHSVFQKIMGIVVCEGTEGQCLPSPKKSIGFPFEYPCRDPIPLILGYRMLSPSKHRLARDLAGSPAANQSMRSFHLWLCSSVMLLVFLFCFGPALLFAVIKYCCD